MKIACVDNSASNRIELQKHIEGAFEKCRHAVGQFSLDDIYPASRKEVLVNQAPDIIVLGPHTILEDAYVYCREFKQAFPNTAIFLFLHSEQYSLRSLRRFEKHCSEIFTPEDPEIRLVHRILSVKNAIKTIRNGKLIAVAGVKGGVGATSIVSGLAHASEAIGRRAVILDLSAENAIAHYMASQRWQSADFAAAIKDRLVPDKSLAEHCITTAPNGINLLLPPAGGSDLRDLWLRDADRFEISLGLIDIIRDLYDIIIVDLARVEGVMPFALSSRADSILLVTSNDPAAVHLLNSQLSDLTCRPGQPNIQILVNAINERALDHEDVLDFLEGNEYFNESMSVLDPLPFDPRGRHWIGTGNSFYTESNSQTQDILEETLKTLLLAPEELSVRTRSSANLLTGLKRIFSKDLVSKQQVTPSVLALPDSSVVTNGHTAPNTEKEHLTKKTYSDRAEVTDTQEQTLVFGAPSAVGTQTDLNHINTLHSNKGKHYVSTHS